MKKILLIVLLTSLTACSTVVHREPATRLTIGVVQKEIYIGMPASDVAKTLGSPNIVYLEENKDEIWVYDKVASDFGQSGSKGGVWLLITGLESDKGHRETNQRTLTVQSHLT